MSCRSFYEEDRDREEKRTQRHSPWETVEGEGSDTWVGILNQNYTEFTVLLQKYSASRLSLFPAALVWAYANKASQARPQRKRSCTITRGPDWQERQTEARKLLLRVFFDLVTTPGGDFLGSRSCESLQGAQVSRWNRQYRRTLPR